MVPNWCGAKREAFPAFWRWAWREARLLVAWTAAKPPLGTIAGAAWEKNRYAPGEAEVAAAGRAAKPQAAAWRPPPRELAEASMDARADAQRHGCRKKSCAGHGWPETWNEA